MTEETAQSPTPVFSSGALSPGSQSGCVMAHPLPWPTSGLRLGLGSCQSGKTDPDCRRLRGLQLSGVEQVTK